jgi:hypothetical protein
MGDIRHLERSDSVETSAVSDYFDTVPTMNATQKEEGRMVKTSNLIHSLRVVAGFALAGAVLSGLTLGWIPALSAVSLQEIGGLVGAGAGLLASLKTNA